MLSDNELYPVRPSNEFLCVVQLALHRMISYLTP